MNTIGARIKQLRLSKNMSAETLGQMVGVAKTSIYRYETGFIEKIPTTVIEKLSKALNVSVAYLMGWTDEPTGAVNTVITEEKQPDGATELSPAMQELVDLVQTLSDDECEQIAEYLAFLKSKRK